MTSELYQKILQEHICLRTESRERGHEDPAMKVNVKVQTINPIKMLWKDVSKQSEEYPPTSQSFSALALRMS